MPFRILNLNVSTIKRVRESIICVYCVKNVNVNRRHHITSHGQINQTRIERERERLNDVWDDKQGKRDMWLLSKYSLHIYKYGGYDDNKTTSTNNKKKKKCILINEKCWSLFSRAAMFIININIDKGEISLWLLILLFENNIMISLDLLVSISSLLIVVV